MAAKTPTSKKAKGSGFERAIAKRYAQKLFPNCRRMIGSGAFEGLKGDINKFEVDRFRDEAKFQETWKVHEWWEQAKSQCGASERPLLHMKRSYGEPLTLMYMEDYFDLREENMDLREEIRRLEEEVSRLYGSKVRPITKEDQVKGLKRRKNGGRDSGNR